MNIGLLFLPANNLFANPFFKLTVFILLVVLGGGLDLSPQNLCFEPKVCNLELNFLTCANQSSTTHHPGNNNIPLLNRVITW